MLFVGTSLSALRRQQEAQQTQQAQQVRGGPVTNTTQTDIAHVDVSGTDTPIFVLGVDNPDTLPGSGYWIP